MQQDPFAGFEAKFDSGTCTRCGADIEQGQRIETASMGRFNRYNHIICPGMENIVCSICGGMWVACDCP